MEEYKKTLFKIAILNDLLDLKLTEINVKNILNPIINSKLRNLKRSTKETSKMMDEIFSNPDIQSVFGEFCDNLNIIIDDKINEILK